MNKFFILNNSGGAVAQLEHDLAYHKKLLNETYENEQSMIRFYFNFLYLNLPVISDEFFKKINFKIAKPR